MENFVRALIVTLLVINTSQKYQWKKQVPKLWRKSLSLNGVNSRRQEIATLIKSPTAATVQNLRVKREPLTYATLLTTAKPNGIPLATSQKPSVTTPKPPVTTPKPPVTTPKPPVTTPKPPVTTPKPPVTTPKPPVTTPKPPVTAPKPPVTVPKPPVTTPKPPVTVPKPPVTTPKPPVTASKPPVTAVNTVVPNPNPTTNRKESQHVIVPEPAGVIPVQTVPPLKFISTRVPPTIQPNNINVNRLNRTHMLLPNLPVYNVNKVTQNVLPVVPVKEAHKQTQINTEINPIEPLPIMTRPTVTVLQHVIGQNPTRATLQSVVVPKRKEAAPPSPLAPLPVIPPQTVAVPLKPLRPLAPLPPQDPLIVHHVPIPIPKDCHDSQPCGCDNNCNGK